MCTLHTGRAVTGTWNAHPWYTIFVFFQAEDGIRDLTVTGVQTCALFFSSRRRHTRFDCDWSSDVCSSDLYFALLIHGTGGRSIYDLPSWWSDSVVLARFASADGADQIGRASCRERV